VYIFGAICPGGRGVGGRGGVAEGRAPILGVNSLAVGLRVNSLALGLRVEDGVPPEGTMDAEELCVGETGLGEGLGVGVLLSLGLGSGWAESLGLGRGWAGSGLILTVGVVVGGALTPSLRLKFVWNSLSSLWLCSLDFSGFLLVWSR
jgi:hypothetical protein